MNGSNIPLDRLRTWLLLGYVTAFLPERHREFVQFYGSLEAAAAASEFDWRRHGLLRGLESNDILSPAFAGAAGSKRPMGGNGWFENQMTAARRAGASILTLEDERYPPLFRTIYDPPCVVYARGAADLSRPSIAVVGARRATEYGLNVAEKIARDLSLSGLSVVSGGARGIDSAAHRGALSVQGSTVAVMGSGLDVAYPSENAPLFDAIAERGALLSEFPFGTSPQPRYFPVRNRLIAGLSLGVVVVEGEAHSGSLITARLAADAGREVFAVPGPITEPASEGPHRLIQDGAKLVRRVEDILDELPPEAAAQARLPLTEEEESGDTALLDAIDAHRACTLDEITARTGKAAGDLLGALMDLELRDKVSRVSGGRYIRKA